MQILCEPEHLYHAARAEYLTNTRLREIRKAMRYGITELMQPRDNVMNSQMLLGRAVHKRVLEGREAFDRSFTNNTSEDSVLIKSAQAPVVLEQESITLVEEMCYAVFRHSIARKLLAEGTPECVVRARYCGEPCQTRMDWFNVRTWTIVELKTTESLDTFQQECDQYEYYSQLAFYRAVLGVTLSCDPIEISCRLIAVERKEPYQVTVCQVPATTLSICQMENEDAIRSWQKQVRFSKSNP